MLATLSVVLPIFALILVGWLARRLGVLGPVATSELNRFVVMLALPTLLFDIIAHTQWRDMWQPGFIAAFGLSSLGVYGLTLALRLRARRPLADAALDGLNAGYSNVGFMGLPLVLVALGPAALAPTTIAVIATVCAIFAVAIVLIEIGLQTERRGGRLAVKVAASLARNPLLVGPAAGAAVSLAGLAIPDGVETFLKLLGGAASPCALVALGLFLAEKSEGGARHGKVTTLLVAFKLLAQPLLAWAIASLLQLSPLLTHTVVLCAALPTGTGPFMLAEFYERDAATTSRVILLSTSLSVATIAGYLFAIG
jgi:predicted permease